MTKTGNKSRHVCLKFIQPFEFLKLCIVGCTNFFLNFKGQFVQEFGMEEPVGYLLLTFPISFLSRWLEKRFRYEM